MSQSSADLWPDATREVDKQTDAKVIMCKPETDILKNRASRVLTLEPLGSEMQITRPIVRREMR